MKQLVLSFLMLTSLNVSAAPALSKLQEAQEAFRHKDTATTVLKLKQTLMEHNNNPLIVGKATKMLSKLSADKSLGTVKLDWSLPPEFALFQLEVRRRAVPNSGRIRHQLIAVGGVKPGATLEQLQVIRYPDKVVLDKQAKIGEWEDEMWDKIQGFWTASERTQYPVEEGLYLVNFKIKGQPVVNGWVILQDLNSSADPVIEKPKLNQEYTTSTPTFNWRKYTSPEYKALTEQRSMRALVSQENAGVYKEVLVANFKEQADVVRYTVGDTKSPVYFEGASSLKAGDYNFTVIYQERSQFGDVTLVRGAASTASFVVK